MTPWTLRLYVDAEPHPAADPFRTVTVLIGTRRGSVRDVSTLSRVVADEAAGRGLLLGVELSGGLADLLGGSGGDPAERQLRLVNLVRPPALASVSAGQSFALVAQSPREAALLFRGTGPLYLLPHDRAYSDVLFMRALKAFRPALDLQVPACPETDDILQAVLEMWLNDGSGRILSYCFLCYSDVTRRQLEALVGELEAASGLLALSSTWRRWKECWGLLLATDGVNWGP